MSEQQKAPKVTITVTQVFAGKADTGTGAVLHEYEVTKLVNATAPRVHARITEDEVQELIGRGITVNIS